MHSGFHSVSGLRESHCAGGQSRRPDARRRRGLFGPLAAAAAALLLAACASKPQPLPACTSQTAPRAICGLMNPEDLARAPGSEWLVISQMAPEDRDADPAAAPSRPGRLLAYRIQDARRVTLYPVPDGRSPSWETAGTGGAADGPSWGDPSCPGPPDPAHWKPHGIDLGRHASGAPLLAVVNHGGREAIEFFEWSEAASLPGLRWRGCVPMVPGAMANDLALFSDGGFVVTQFMPAVTGVGPRLLWSGMKIAAGWRTGQVFRWHPGGALEPVPGSGGSAPNGVAIAPDERSVFFSEWGGEAITRVPLDPGQGPPRASVPVGYHPDNLTWSEAGQLLAAGQVGSLSTIIGCGAIPATGCGLDYGVSRIDPDTLREERILSGRGAASVALDVSGELFVGAFTGDQIERFDLP